MDIRIKTLNGSCLAEVSHIECIKLPTVAAYTVRDHMGMSYRGTPTMNCWSGVFEVPTPCGQVDAPFELVICNRGASIRCLWEQHNLVREIVDRMQPELMIEVMEAPARRH